MLDDFRDLGDFDEEAAEEIAEEKARPVAAESHRVFGMTPVQRFVLVMLFFLSMCMLGTFCLLVTDKIALPLY